MSAPLTAKILGNILKERRTYLNSKYRKDGNLTMREIAVRSHIGLGYVSEIESGKKQVSESILLSVLPYYEITLSQVYHQIAERLEIYENADIAHEAAGMLAVQSIYRH